MKRNAESAALWSAECWAFVDYWASLRDRAMVPTTEMFFDHPQPRFIPQIYIVDVLETEALIRMQGEETVAQWGSNVTGRVMMHTQPPAFRRQALENLRNVVDRPCGMMAKVSLKTTRNRTTTSEVVRLPLVQQPGRPPRVVCFSLKDTSRVEQETFTTYYETHQSEWLDIGAGIPDAPPANLFSPE